jgi:hypothetical protein
MCDPNNVLAGFAFNKSGVCDLLSKKSLEQLSDSLPTSLGLASVHDAEELARYYNEDGEMPHHMLPHETNMN